MTDKTEPAASAVAGEKMGKRAPLSVRCGGGGSCWDQGSVGALGLSGALVPGERQRGQRVAAQVPGLVGDQDEEQGGECRGGAGRAPAQAALGGRFGQRVAAGRTQRADTLGTSSGDWLSDDTGLGFRGAFAGCHGQ
ncbi:hypothetical protein GCM10010289_78930 [Streptomyces violascens]|nr:hypothetical protein GCM10010289_78930 [Streptomyces violascens]